MATAAIVSGKPQSAIFPINEMYPWPDTDDGAVIDRVFNELGYAPLSAYLSHKDARVFLHHGSDTWSALQNEIGDATGDFGVFGHAVLLPAMGHAACGEHFYGTEICGLNMGECGGFRLVFEDWEPQELELI